MRFADGRYELVRELGHGGMGQVFEVRIAATGGRAALKTLRSALAADPDYLERFRREAIAIGTLEHPHLVRCFDFGIAEDGTAYLVMELVEGRSLFDVVEADGPLDADVAIRVGSQICAALEVAHAAGVVHRDLKPSNVVLTQGYDGGLVAKVIDFGVASIKSSGVYKRLTGSGEIVGTPNYMAPEQLDASHHVDARTDVYGVGATLYGVLAGRPPYPGPTLAVVIEPLLAGDHPKLSTLRPDLGRLADVVERAMALKPEDRYADVIELRRALESVRSDTATLPVAERSRAPLVMGIALAFAAGIGTVLFTSPPESTPDLIEPVAVELDNPAVGRSEVAVEAEAQEADADEDADEVEDDIEAVETAETDTADAPRMRDAPMRAPPANDSVAADWTRLQVTFVAHPGSSDTGPLRMMIQRRRESLARCLERVGAPVQRLILTLDLDLAPGSSGHLGAIPYPASDCVGDLLEPDDVRPLVVFEGRVQLSILP